MLKAVIRKPLLFAVMGSPIAHSLSPEIYQAFAEQVDIILRYKKLDVDKNALAHSIANFRFQGGLGVSITAPLKESMFLEAQMLTNRARDAHAVNNVMFTAEGIIGDNTDGIGFVRDLIQNQITIRDQKVLILGAGGAVRGILRILLGLSPRKLVLVNRIRYKALALSEYFKSSGKVWVSTYESLKRKQFDVVIHGTSAGLLNELPPLPDEIFLKKAQCYDLNYHKAAKPFLTWARRHGAVKMVDGLGMLVEQAAETFYTWNQARPNTKPILEKLRKKLAAE